MPFNQVITPCLFKLVNVLGAPNNLKQNYKKEILFNPKVTSSL